MVRSGGDLGQLIAVHSGRFHFIIPSQLHLERPSLIEKLKAGDLKLT